MHSNVLQQIVIEQCCLPFCNLLDFRVPVLSDATLSKVNRTFDRLVCSSLVLVSGSSSRHVRNADPTSKLSVLYYFVKKLDFNIHSSLTIIPAFLFERKKQLQTFLKDFQSFD